MHGSCIYQVATHEYNEGGVSRAVEGVLRHIPAKFPNPDYLLKTCAGWNQGAVPEWNDILSSKWVVTPCKDDEIE